MKQIITIGAALLLLNAGSAQAQNSIEQVLRNIETNNKELQANKQLIQSQKLEARTDNNLPDPTLSYAHLWGSKDKSETIGELVVSQSFDFPSLYATRNKLNRLKIGAYDSQADVFRQEKLLQAKELCLDIIMLRQQKQILEERLRNAEELAKMYAKRLQTGDANALETNKINLELLNVKTEVSLNETALRNKLQELSTLNGNLPVVFEESQYPAVPFPTDFNGLVVGFSFPLFENRNKVKIAKAQALNIDLQRDNAALQVESELAQLYREAKTLHASMEEYTRTFRSQQDLALLKQALTGGQISMIEYFVEVSVLYQSHQNYLQLENQYQKAMARIYKSKL